MRKKVTYVSELGRAYATPEEAIADDKRLPQIIATYEADLVKMEANPEAKFGSAPITPEMMDNWREAIAGYKAKWEAAQQTWSEFGESLAETLLKES